MMKKIIIPVIIVLSYYTGISQGMEGILENIEKNNPTFSSLDKWLEAEKSGAVIGLAPEDPTISFNYLFGNEPIGGNQYEFEVSQTLRLPNYYRTKADLNELNYQRQEAYAAKRKREVVYHLKATFLDLVMLKETERYYESRYEKANDLLFAVEAGIQEGLFSRVDYDKALVYSLNALNDLDECKLQIESQTNRLLQLNGGIAIDELIYEYPDDSAFLNLDTLENLLLKNNSDLGIARLDQMESEMTIKYERVNNLPSFELGYKSERILDQALRGFHAGLSIPLYENAKKKNYAILRKEWVDTEYDQLAHRLLSELRICHLEAVEFKRNFQRIDLFLAEKAVQKNALELLQANQITIREFILDLDLMHELTLNYYFLKYNYYLKLTEIDKLIGN
jgi:outer membrane protein TolC